MERSVVLFPLFLLAISATNAQVAPVIRIGGGGTLVTNHLDNYVEPGYHFKAGAGVRLAESVELLGEFDFHQLGVDDAVLAELEAPDGNTRILSVTGNIKYLFGQQAVQPYVIGGGGWYRRTVDFTEPATGLVTVYDPWWGWVGDVAVPTNRLLGSISRNAGGVNAGGGVSFQLQDRTRIFVEVRWHRAFHNPTNSTIVPITVGISF